MSKRYKANRRFRYYVQREICQVCGHHPATPCYLPEPPRFRFKGQTPVERKPDEVLCSEHAARNGYCRSCGDFWGGIESFEFIHRGLCDHCHDQIKSDYYYPSDDEDDYYAMDDCADDYQ